METQIFDEVINLIMRKENILAENKNCILKLLLFGWKMMLIALTYSTLKSLKATKSAK